jgi:hypothetical protein
MWLKSSHLRQKVGRFSGNCQQNCQQISEEEKTSLLLWQDLPIARYRKSLVSPKLSTWETK